MTRTIVAMVLTIAVAAAVVAAGAWAQPAFAGDALAKHMAAGGHAFIIVGDQSAELTRETQIVAENSVRNNNYAVEGLAYAKTNLVDRTITWGLVGTQAAVVVHTARPELAIAFHGMPGVDVRDYVPKLVKTSPYRGIGRIVGTTEMRFNSASHDVLFHEDVIPTTTDVRAAGEARIVVDGPLDPGEYAIVLRPIDARAPTSDLAKSFTTFMAGSAGGATQPWQYAWCFSVSPASAQGTGQIPAYHS